MSERSERKLLVVGLGNPGVNYEMTRHNIGAAIVRAYARSQMVALKKVSKLKGEVALANIRGQGVIFLIPTTYMNLSGIAVQNCIRYYQLDPSDLIVLSDDIYVPFGRFRMREKGGSGGHKGLKDIEARLNTTEFCRLRIGIGQNFVGDLAGYVLESFSYDELKKIPEIIVEGEAVLDLWITKDQQTALHFANAAQVGDDQGEMNEKQ